MPYDKKIHLLGSALVCLILSQFLPLNLSSYITFSLGLIKEIIYDGYLHKGTPEVNDLVADMLGILLAVLIRSLIQ